MRMFRNGYWQKLIILLTILIELGLLICFAYYFANGIMDSNYAFAFLLAIWLLSLTLDIYVINSSASDAYKIVWLFFVAAIPLIGPVFYLLFAHKLRTKKQKEHLTRYFDVLRKDKTTPEVTAKLERFSPDCAAISRYVEKASDGAVYQNTSIQYFPVGDEALSVMLSELRKAHHYIFLEYFIIKPGQIWDQIFAILKSKAKEGLDVRVVYDDFGNLGATPIDFAEKLRKDGIDCRIFRPIRPVLDVRMNNRDHRKIMVIDGHTCFTGGINLADEYFNITHRFGHWKDNCIMVKGKAVYGYNLLFLANWISNFARHATLDYAYYAPETFIDEAGGFPVSDGFVQPYGDLPYADNAVGESVYLQIIGRAKRYVYISTPYLVIDEKLSDALRIAALQGIDVRLLTPGMPDKKMVYQLTRLNYGPLLRSGVRIYEYTPGFVHQKMFVADDEDAAIGTINLDYRSLYLHMENGTFIAGNSSVGAMRQDFADSIAVSHEVTCAEWEKWRKRKLIPWALLRLVAPLL